MRDFYRAFWGNVVAYMSGIASVVFWLFSALLEGSNVPLSVRLGFIVAGGLAMLHASYRVWKDANYKAAQRISECEAKIVRLQTQLSSKEDELARTIREFRTPKVVFLDEVDAGAWKHHFRINVKNESDSVAERVGVHLFRSEPFMPHLPVPLHCSHEIRPHSDEVNLNPGATRTFDVFRIGTHIPGELDIAGAGMEEVIPRQKYRLTLRVHGRDFPPTEKDFIFDPKPDGTFAFYAAPRNDATSPSTLVY